MSQLNATVALMVFNRPGPTRRVFAAIAAARPTRLLVVADGPRADREGERQICDEVRKIVSAVDWPCKVETNFSEENLGCRRRIISGLDWVFSLAEEAIILEDDCLPDPSFFPYCAELLERYRDCDQIGIIGGFNPMQQSFPFSYSYYFTTMVHIWGWATWRRTWRKYDASLAAWPAIRQSKLLAQMWKERKPYELWTGIFDKIHAGVGPDTWDYQLVYSLWIQNLLNVVPRRNLIQNIGFDEYATHTKSADPGLMIQAQNLNFPITHPPAMTDWPDYAESFHHRFTSPSLLRRVRTRIESVLSRATPSETKGSR
jgi:hypothetical protein